jgi:small subunit ribosomal protein S4
MARYTGPRVRISRRFGTPIFGPTKYLERRNYGPGVHGPKSRRKHTDYGLGLIEKQKLRYYYGLLERQFRGVYEKALRRRGVTGEQMLQILETRLDNVVFHLGFANTRAAARQMVAHGHVTVNGRKVSIPSYALKVNDVIGVKNNNVSRQVATKNLELATSRAVPDWLSLNKEEFKGTVMRIPTRDEIQPIANEQAVVEFYSREQLKQKKQLYGFFRRGNKSAGKVRLKLLKGK